MYIVLKTEGKSESVDFVTVKLFESKFVTVKLFESKTDADKYCKDNTDEVKDEKYWKFAEIIQDGTKYEPARYVNH